MMWLLYFGHYADIDFSSDNSYLSFSWSAYDPESGIEHCAWAVGKLAQSYKMTLKYNQIRP